MPMCTLAYAILFLFIVFTLGIFHWLKARARDEIIASRLNLVKKYRPEKNVEKIKKKIRDGNF